MNIKSAIKKYGHFIKGYIRVKDTIRSYNLGIKYTNDNKDVKRPLNVLFIISYPEVWNSLKSVYDHMVSSDSFNPTIITMPKHLERLKQGEAVPEDWDEASLFMQKSNIPFVRAYDNGILKDSDTFKPDYVIYTRPYNTEYPSGYKSTDMCKKSRVCYIPYAYSMLTGQAVYTVMPEAFIYSAHRVFLANESRKKQCEELFFHYNKDTRERFQYLGFPRFDLIHDNSLHEKRTVAWLPRWVSSSVNKNLKPGHFMDYYERFLTFADTNPDIDLIIRPHPKMIDTYLEQGIMTEQQVKIFKEKCEKMHNVFLDTNKDYMDTLVKADVLVADYTSLIAEYFVTGKPIVFCDTSDGLNEEGNLIVKNTYYAPSFEKVEEQIVSLLNGNDVNKAEREKVIRELLPIGVGDIGKNIAQAILEDFRR